jgi:hypothetical protein
MPTSIFNVISDSLQKKAERKRLSRLSGADLPKEILNLQSLDQLAQNLN